MVFKNTYTTYIIYIILYIFILITFLIIRKNNPTKINAWILYKFPKDKQKKTKYYFIDQFTVGDILINTLITKNN